MRIVSWNCCGKLKNSYHMIKVLNPDICIIQDMKNPQTDSDDDDYLDFTDNLIYLEYDDSGIGIFARKDIKLIENNWITNKNKNFLSVNINEIFNIVGVWVANPYMKNIQQFTILNKSNIEDSDKLLVIGDFNIDASNIEERNVINKLESLKLKSIYHEKYQEKLGNEQYPTFYQYYHKDNTSHIDYALQKGLNIIHFEVGTFDKYVVNPKKYSNHVPLIVDIDI